MAVTYANPPKSSGDASDLGYGQILGLIWRQRWWVVLGLLIGLGIGGLVTMRQKPTYLSTTQLLIEPNYQSKSRGTKVQDEFTDTDVQIDPATQISILQSSNLLMRAMDRLKARYPEFNPQIPGSIDFFKKDLTIVQLSASAGGKKNADPTKIFQIGYTSDNPSKTRDVLEALQEVYRDYNKEQQNKRIDDGLKFVRGRIPEIREQLQQSEGLLEQFRTKQGVIDPKSQAQAQTELLIKVQQDLQTTVSQLRELQQRYLGLQQELPLNPQQALLASRLSQSARYQGLLNELQKTELTLVQQQLRFKNNTPYVQQVLDQRQRQLGLLKTEASRVIGAAVNGASGDSLIAGGQLGALDLGLVNQLVDTQVNLQTMQARYYSLRETEQQLRSELQRYPKLLAQFDRLQPEVDLNRDTLNQLLKAEQELALELAQGGFDWQIIEQPQLGLKTGPSLTRNLILGAIAGLFLGGVIGFGREASDSGVHSSEELRNAVSLPLLGTVPTLYIEITNPSLIKLPFSKRQEIQPDMAQLIRWQPFRESLDLLYQNLNLHCLRKGIQSIVVTSALAGEGKSTLALGLAISAARLHQRVLLIDADLRRPSLHKLLNLPNDQGLSTLLAQVDPETESPMMGSDVNRSLRSNVSIVTSGPVVGDPAKLLSSEQMRRIVEAFKQTYDLVIVDSPPLLGMVDALVMGSYCDGVLLVGRLDRVTRPDLAQSMTMMKSLNVIGVVANGTAAPLGPSDYYAYAP